MHQHQEGPTIIYGDNKAAIAHVLNPDLHMRTKHIDTAAHWIREQRVDGHIDVEWIKTSDQAADCLTKPLGGEALRRMAEKIGIGRTEKKNQLRKKKKGDMTRATRPSNG